MKEMFLRSMSILMVVLFGAVSPLAAFEKNMNQDIKGWEADSPYNRLYEPDRMETIKGRFLRTVPIRPMADMVEGLGMVVELHKGEEATIHVGPAWFAHMLVSGFKKGDPVKAKGCWAELDGKRFFMAAKLREGEVYEVKVRRTRDGRPYWVLTPQELIREKRDAMSGGAQ